MYHASANELTKMALKKQELIEKFLSLTEEQSTAITNKNYDNMFKFINEKQSIIEQVNLIDLELKAITPEDREKIGAITAKTKAIMSQAIALDEENICSLRENQAEVAQKIKELKKKKEGHHTYRGKNAALEGILLDHKK